VAQGCLQVSEDKITAGYTCAEFHPDGMLLGTGTANASLDVWETRFSKVCFAITIGMKLAGEPQN